MVRENLLKDIIAKQSHQNGTEWQPEILHLSVPNDIDRFEKIVEEKKPIVTDDISSQLGELIKCRHPKRRFSKGELQDEIGLFLNGSCIEEFGCWVYYGWSNRLVHLLPESEFIEVRTNRNHYKISLDEEKTLKTKRVGLIGLSVGQSVAVTMAMERGFGELRLADFDDLELTNLNRIRTGVHNLGVPKVISVAREIMEIDPFLKLKCFTQGLTEENMDEFFHGGGDLDLLIDECDGLDMKIISRWKARQMKIPVVMEASDRGMVDVERFDLEPERPILHGMVEDLSPDKLKTLETNEDKIPYMLAIVGADTISARAKASMIEIGETISTWPQLASAVTLGGGITADVVRRIFLDEYHESGRYYVDVEEIIGNSEAFDSEHSQQRLLSKPSADFGPAIDGEISSKIETSTIGQIIESACHAPSGGNLQPWKWRRKGDILQLTFDENLVSSFLDENRIASMIALGASIENACLEATNQNLNAEVNYFPSKNSNVIAQISLKRGGTSDSIDGWLGSNIRLRETNRNIDPSEALKIEHMRRLEDCVVKGRSQLILIEHGEDFDELSDIIASTEKFRIMHPEGHRNFNEEMRWSAEEAENSRDGIDINTCDLTVDELTGFKLARDPKVISKLTDWKGGSAFKKLSLKGTSSASALGIIVNAGITEQDYLDAGRDMERVWIGANALGIGFQPQSPLTLLLPKLETKNSLTRSQFEELSHLGKRLESVLTRYSNNRPVFMFRLFYKQKEVTKSLRRDIRLQFKDDE